MARATSRETAPLAAKSAGNGLVLLGVGHEPAVQQSRRAGRLRKHGGEQAGGAGFGGDQGEALLLSQRHDIGGGLYQCGSEAAFRRDAVRSGQFDASMRHVDFRRSSRH
jgi:hypothetical protein